MRRIDHREPAHRWAREGALLLHPIDARAPGGEHLAGPLRDVQTGEAGRALGMEVTAMALRVVAKDLPRLRVERVDLGHDPPAARAAPPTRTAIQWPERCDEFGLVEAVVGRGIRLADDLAIDELEALAVRDLWQELVDGDASRAPLAHGRRVAPRRVGCDDARDAKARAMRKPARCDPRDEAAAVALRRGPRRGLRRPCSRGGARCRIRTCDLRLRRAVGT